MEVTLRKTKITASILKQMQHANTEQIFTYKVLGYFVIQSKFGPSKRALLQSYDNEDCKLCIMVDNYNVSVPNINGTCYLDVNGYKVGTSYKNLDPTYARDLGERFIEIKNQANKLGQIFY